MTRTPVEIVIRPNRVAAALLAVVLALWLVSLAFATWSSLPDHHSLPGSVFVNVDRERSLPTWYSSSMLLLCACTLALITSFEKSARADWGGHWGGLSIFFLFLSLDEALGLHERSIDPLREAFDLSGVLYFAWILPGTLVMLFLLAAYLRFLKNLPPATRLRFLAAGVTFFSGALGLEMVGSMFGERGDWGLGYSMVANLEELLEMLGVVVFFYALLKYLAAEGNELRVTVVGTRRSTRG